jgi:hypothetical protein
MFAYEKIYKKGDNYKTEMENSYYMYQNDDNLYDFIINCSA